MLRLNVAKLKQEVENFDVFRTVGKVRSARGIITAELPSTVADACQVWNPDGSITSAEVVGFDRKLAQIMPFQPLEGLQSGAAVVALGRKQRIPVGMALLGRVIDALGAPIDGRGPIRTRRRANVWREAPAPLERPTIREPVVTGQRVIDGLLSLGKGQRVGLFSGSGVGKSTLLGEIAKGARTDLNVIALVGERGREVRPFLEDCLGEEGLARSVVVVSTSDEPPLMRVRATQAAICIADDFRRQGADVLLLLDSLTRLAMAQREIGLLMGEPPSSRGYTPSVFQTISRLMEHLGTSADGSITGIMTVLVDGDDLDEPISDAVRATIDGHIVLDRRNAEQGHFPAVNVGASLSRVFRDVTNAEHQLAARKLRAILNTHREVVDLIRIGGYTRGTSPEVDLAIDLQPAVAAFTQQDIGQYSPFEETRRAMEQIAAVWPY